MKVKDLIERLKKYPDDMDVVVYGYESDYDKIRSITTIDLYENENHSWWDGELTKNEIKGEEEKTYLYLYSGRR